MNHIKHFYFLFLLTAIFLSGCKIKSQTPSSDRVSPGGTDSGTSDSISLGETGSGTSESVIMNAYVTGTSDKVLNVICLDDESTKGLITVSLPESNLTTYAQGDIIAISYSGLIQESYPAQLSADKIELLHKRTALEDAPSNYTLQDAVKEYSYYVSRFGTTNQFIFDEFVNNISAFEDYTYPFYIRIVQFTIEGDPIILDISTEGGKNPVYTIKEDTTRDLYRSKLEITEDTWNYVHRFQLQSDTPGKPGDSFLVFTNEEALPEEMQNGQFSKDFQGYFLSLPLDSTAEK